MEVKTGSYQVQVHIIEVRDLKPEDPNGTSDPVVYVEVEEKQHTEVKQKQTTCVFDDLLFDFKNMDRDKMDSMTVNLKVYDADALSRNDLIGAWSVDLVEVYFSPGHEPYRRWVGLADEKGEIVRVQGYLKRRYPSFTRRKTPDSRSGIGARRREIEREKGYRVHGSAGTERPYRA